jgi:hypothetical protein
MNQGCVIPEIAKQLSGIQRLAEKVTGFRVSALLRQE